MHVYIIISTDDPHCESVITLMAESDDQALQMASKACAKSTNMLSVYTKSPITGQPVVVEETTNYYTER